MITRMHKNTRLPPTKTKAGNHLAAVIGGTWYTIRGSNPGHPD